MKKLLKYTLIAGGCSLLIGLCMAAVLAAGFTEEIIAHKDELSINETNFMDYFEVEEHFSITRSGHHYSSDETKEKMQYTVPDEEEITELDFTFAVGDITIKTGDTMQITAKNIFENAIETETRNGVWYIKDTLTDHGSVHSGYAPVIEITIPKGMKFEDMELVLNAGKLYAEELCAQTAEVEVDAGSLQVKKLKVEESLMLNNGVGEVVVYDISAKNVTVDNGIGAVSLCGSITGDNYVTCGIGEVNVQLTDRAECDFGYNIDCGIGEVVVDGEHYKGNVNHSNRGREHHSEDHFDLDCGIGRIEIKID